MSAADLSALAAAAAKLPGWKWRAGMRAALIDDGRRVWSGVLDGTYHVAADAIPVLSDPATGGWMLALLCASASPATVEVCVCGDEVHATFSLPGYTQHKGTGASLGEACARIALQIGRWA